MASSRSLFFSGLLQRSPLGPAEEATVPETWYEFRAGIRELLLENSPVQRTAEIWREIGYFIQHHYGSPRDFQALIPTPAGSIQDLTVDRELYFAEVDAAVLMTWGGEYASRAQELRAAVTARKREISADGKTVTQLEGFPPIQIFTFEVATIEEETNNLQIFEFEVALIEVNQSVLSTTDNLIEIVDEKVFERTEKHLNDVERLVVQGTLANQTYEQIAASAAAYSVHHLKNVGIKLWKILSEVFGKKVTKRTLQNVLKQWAISRKITIHRERKQSQYFTEELGDEVGLDMISIPGGSFLMGSPKEELESYDDERPQHQVTVPSFYMGRYPITQEQWRVVAGWEQVERELDSDPSDFKEDYSGIDRWQRPVERVSWEEAKEFCARLSQKTGKEYRLPTESEWEYACRAGTTTPFHFGETISTELANYYGEATYGEGVEGENRRQTTPVGYFKVANNFGLSDMHGNVIEWCEDDWHENYENAPTNGSAWFSSNISIKVIRSGSWDINPGYSRSAYRGDVTRVLRNDTIGIRVVCVAPRTT